MSLNRNAGNARPITHAGEGATDEDAAASAIQRRWKKKQGMGKGKEQTEAQKRRLQELKELESAGKVEQQKVDVVREAEEKTAVEEAKKAGKLIAAKSARATAAVVKKDAARAEEREEEHEQKKNAGAKIAAFARRRKANEATGKRSRQQYKH